jgi:ATP-dependent Lon protease
MNKNTIPVLYLFENVFFPETIIPLILSDEPSKTLVREAFKNDLAIALFSTHEKAKGVATAGKILILDEKKEEGKLTAVITGIERIKLLKITQHVPFPIFEFTHYQDFREPQILQPGALERLHFVFEKWINRHIQNINDREIFLREINTPRKLLFNISLFMIKDIELKLMLLESTSIADRLSLMNALLTGETPESEDLDMASAIKNFESLDHEKFKLIAN